MNPQPANAAHHSVIETISNSTASVIDLGKVGHRELKYLIQSCADAELTTGLINHWEQATPRRNARQTHRNHRRRSHQRKQRHIVR